MEHFLISGLEEVRLYEMGEKDYFKNLIIEAQLVNNFEHIYSCTDMHELFTRNDEFPEVSSVLN